MSSTSGVPTWRNVDGSGMTQAAGQLGNAYSNYARDISNLGNALSGLGGSFANREQELEDKTKEANTQDYISKLAQAQSLDDINRMKATGALDPLAYKNLTNGLVDQAKINSAFSSWNADTYNRASNADNLLGFSEQSKQVQGQIQSLISEGRFQEAGNLLAQNQSNLPQSMLTSLGKTISDAQNQWGTLQVNQQNANTNTAKTQQEIVAETTKQETLAKQAQDASMSRIKMLQESWDQAHPDKLWSTMSTEERQQVLASDPELTKNYNAYSTAMSVVNANNQVLNTMAGTVGSPNYNGALNNGSGNTRAVVNSMLNETAQMAGVSPSSLTGLISTESNYNSNAKNPRSTATGIGQFTKGTYQSYAKKYGLPLIQEDGKGNIIYDPRTDPTVSMKAIGYMVKDINNSPAKSKAMQAGLNEATFVKAGMFFGTGGVNKVIDAYRANPNTPIDQIVSSDVMKANSELLNGKTVGQVLSSFNDMTAKAIQKNQANYNSADYTPMSQAEFFGLGKPTANTQTTPATNQTNQNADTSTASNTNVSATETAKETKNQTVQEAINSRYLTIAGKSKVYTNEDGSLDIGKTLESVSLDTDAIRQDIEATNNIKLSDTAKKFVSKVSTNGAMFTEVMNLLNINKDNNYSNLSEDAIKAFEEKNKDNPDALKAMMYYKQVFNGLSKEEKARIIPVLDKVKTEIESIAGIDKNKVLYGKIEALSKEGNPNYVPDRGAMSLISANVYENGTTIKLPNGESLSLSATATSKELGENVSANIKEMLYRKGGGFWDNSSLKSALDRAMNVGVPMSQLVELFNNAIAADKHFNGGNGEDFTGFAYPFSSKQDIVTAVENAIDGLILVNNSSARDTITNQFSELNSTKDVLLGDNEFKVKTIQKFLKDKNSTQGTINYDTWASNLLRGEKYQETNRYLTSKQKTVSEQARKLEEAIFGKAGKARISPFFRGKVYIKPKSGKDNPYVESSSNNGRQIVLKEQGKKELETLIQNAEYSPKAREFLQKLKDSGIVIR